MALLIVELFPRQLIGIFGAANESLYYTEYAVKCFRVYLCMMVLAGRGAVFHAGFRSADLCDLRFRDSVYL